MAMEYDYYQQHIHHPGDPITPAKTWWIWKVFWILLAVTSVEVGLALMNYNNVWGATEPVHHKITKWLKFIYIFLTLAKAYFIVFSYMHLKDEKRSLQLTLGFLAVVLTYFVILMMNEGYHQNIIHYDFPEFMQRNPEGGPGGH
jgi:cytochrome c oxidase subunit 4